MRKIQTLVFLFLVAAAVAGVGNAAKIVFDPKNFAKNAVEAAQAVRQTAIQANQLATETQH